MMSVLLNKLRRFTRSEDGTSTIEFVYWFPFFLYVGYSGMDLGLLSYSHANLERALDGTIREVRLNRLPDGETEWTHDLLKEMICERAFITNCASELALEMALVDPRAGRDLDPEPYCLDTPVEIGQPARIPIFERGSSNDLMIVRACVEVTPAWGFSMMADLVKRGSQYGQWQLHATSVFVHEPFGGSSDSSSTGGSSGTSDDGTDVTL